MIYLYSMVAAVAILGFLPSKYGLRQNHCKNYLIICGVLITLVYGLRSIYVGTGDTYAYAYRFLQLRKYDNFGDFFNEKLADVDFMASETGYYLSLWLLGRVVEDPQWLVFTSTAFITWSTCRFFYKNAVFDYSNLHFTQNPFFRSFFDRMRTTVFFVLFFFVFWPFLSVFSIGERWKKLKYKKSY